MPATVHVIARVRAKEGKEEALKAVLVALIPPSRREIACYQYDLLQSSADPREFSLVERWDGEPALDQHAKSDHVAKAGTQMADLVEAPPDIRRYRPV
jgi:quinol monooxygenase YgiN